MNSAIREARLLLLAPALLAAAACVADVGDARQVGAATERLTPGDAELAVLLVGDEAVAGCPAGLIRRAAEEGPLELAPVPSSDDLVVVLDAGGRPLCVDHAEHVLDLIEESGAEAGFEWVDWENEEVMGDPHPWPIRPAEAMGDPHPWPIRPEGEEGGSSGASGSSEMDLGDYEVEGHEGSAVPGEPDEAAPDVPGTPEPRAGT